VWGGIAGCLPVLIGWAAITNSLSWTAFWFFMVIFFWTPPHFWALAIKYKDDYAAAGIPMLPVVAPINKVEQQMWFHTIAMIVTSFLTFYSADLPIWLYFLNAILAVIFIFQMLGLRKNNIEKSAATIFHGSITYLSLYSMVLVIGAFVK
jgi:protoheme IX farnesyltransferase